MIDIIKAIQTKVGAKADGIWGPKTQAAVASKLNCASDTKSIQKIVGVTADGILGPKSYSAILAKLNGSNTIAVPSSTYDLFLDAGHTNDFTREHPSQFTAGIWEKGKGLEIAKLLGFNAKTNDSIEHMLNVKICEATKAEAEAQGLKVYYYDNPNATNNAEISTVYTKSNSIKPKVFLSVHNNAAGVSGWKNLTCKASGTVTLYKNGSTQGKKLAEIISKHIINARKSNNGPHNRAASTATSTVAVLSKAASSIPAALVEVGFYDNADDLLWMSQNIKLIAKAIVNAIKEFIR